MKEKLGNLMRVPQAAERLAVRESTIRKMIFEKRLPVVRIGRTVTIPEDAIEKMISDGYSAARQGTITQ